MNFTSIISSDFEVKVISQINETTLMGAAKGLFLHLVIHHNNTLYQNYIHRHELAGCLLLGRTESNPTTHKLSSGLSIKISQKPQELFILFRGDELPIKLKGSALGKALIKDADLLNDIREKSTSPSYRDDITQQINNPLSEIVFSPWEIEIAAFEFSLLEQKKKYRFMKGARSVLKYYSSEYFPLDTFLMMEDNTIFTSDNCDCGSEGCFFDFLKETLTTHFQKKERFLTNGEFDKKKAEKILKTFWDNRSNGERAVLIFMENEFYNSVFLNIALLNEHFELEEYLRLMTYPYQPDSEDEAFVRTIATVSHYYLTLLKQHSAETAKNK